MTKRIPSQLVDAASSSFYQSEAKIHPREVKGPLQRLRMIALVWLLGMFYVFPWLNWEGRQAVLFDLPARKFYVFGFSFWPQDFIFLTLLLTIAALALFFFTTLAGRLWCGYACPQTVWTEVFFMMERWCEGDRAQRIKLDRAPWSLNKLKRRGGKYALFALFSLWTGMTFVGCFSSIREFAPRLLLLQASGWETFWTLFYALATFGNAGFLREQVCKYMCPYARFQSAMFDRNTLLIAYDVNRGEPRGPRKRGELLSALMRIRPALASSPRELPNAKDNTPARNMERATLGDCIDCNICVQVCPTGIDIRQGLQYECIACGACVDACNGVMQKMDYPKGLIRYTSLNALEGQPTHVLRLRTLIYSGILLTLLAVFGYGITHRNELLIDVLHDRKALFRVTPTSIENDYVMKLANKASEARRFVISTPSDQAVQLRHPISVTLAAESVQAVPLILSAEPGLPSHHRVRILVTPQNSTEVQPLVRQAETVFFGPSK
jgi:polyferredoxin